MDYKLPDDELLEAIAERFTADLRAGKSPSIREYQSAHPEMADEIQSVLSSIVMIEQLKHSSSADTHQSGLLDKFADLQQIDHYKILEEIGRGGMGVVFAAQHELLGRKVAIKVLPTPPLEGAQVVERFRREAQAAAKLHHTNIVSVFGVGQGEGFHYYVMDLVEGRCLSEVIAELRKTVGDLPSKHYPWVATLGSHLADALSTAHSSHILHRDIKPSNLILDHQGRLWITDFGLAKDIASSGELTRIGDVVGTPQYLPPESLDGQYDQRSEVYGVGLILFELVTLSPAYRGGSPAELIKAIATRSPPAVRKANGQVPLDLATIIDKALSRDPDDRYPSAEALRQDLVAFIDQRPITARRPSLVETTQRWLRCNPLAAGLAMVSIGLLCLVAITATYGYMTAKSALEKEADITRSLRRQQQATETARQEAERNLEMLEAQHRRAESNLALSIEAFDEMFKAVIARGVHSNIDVDIDGYREISGIETALTKQDAEFLDRMVSFYEQFAALNAENDSLRDESAKAYRRLGNIYQLVGQMEPAIEAYEKSLTLLPEVDTDSDRHQALLLTRVRTRNEMSNALRRAGALLPAQQSYRTSIKMLESSPLCEHDPEVRLELARSLASLGFNVQRTFAPTSPLRVALRDWPGRNPPDSPNPPAARRESVPRNTEGRPRSNSSRIDPNRSNSFRSDPARNERSPLFGAGGELERARRVWERENKPLNLQAIEILDALIEQNPGNAEVASVRATCYWNLAAATIDEDRDQGVQYRTQALDALEELVQKRPENPEYQYLLALACSLVISPMDEEEVSLLRRGSEAIQQLIERYPAMLDYHHLHANLRVKHASYCIVHQQRDEAYQELRSARNSIQYLLRRAMSDRSFSLTLNLLTRELQHLGRSYREDGNTRMAVEINQYLMQIRSARNEN